MGRENPYDELALMVRKVKEKIKNLEESLDKV